VADDANAPEKKLYIDEDWKTQVEREKQAARQAEPSATAGPEQATPPPDAATPMPPADFLFLIGTLFLQGAIALGMLPNPVSNQAHVQRDQAKHVIELLTMLQQKTEGNRTLDESTELENILHQLRMAYVTVGESAEAKD
jgi:hypothetical protein